MFAQVRDAGGTVGGRIERAHQGAAHPYPNTDAFRLRGILDCFADLAVHAADHPTLVVSYDTVLSRRPIMT